MKRPVLFAASAALLLAAGAAQASRVNWSVGINLPPVATVVSSGPGYAPYYGPAPVYAPAYPVYAPPVAYSPPPVYYPRPAFYPRPFAYPPAVRVWYDGRRDWDRGRWDRGGRDHHDHDGRGDWHRGR